MEKSAAQKLVQVTLQDSFDKERFVNLVKNILNRIEEAHFTNKGKYIFDDFVDSIQLFERVGKYQSPDEKLVDILIVHLAKDTSLDRARTKQRNFVAKYLNRSRGNVLKDAALVAFVAPNGEDWRFSLVKMEYKFNEKGKVEEELTPARRYSFLVGKNENSHTAQSRLLPLLLNDEVNPTLAQLEEAFSVERVTKEFFEKYRDLFLRLKELLDDIIKENQEVKANFTDKNVSTTDFAKKLLGQIVFLYFLQKKGWFGIERDKEWGSGSKHFLRELFEKRNCGNNNFFNDILEPLFYEALRHERPGDYYSRFNCRIPFLNGGLFDPIGDYNWWKTDILLPNDIFSNNRKTKEGDTGDGILDVFDRYNFTVKEDEPLEKEVAIDPEMLGKVFENLLEVKDRKSKGTYYTPREIVHYMCQESLVNYLATELKDKVSKEDIKTLIKYGESVVEHDKTYLKKTTNNENYKGRYDKAKLPESIRNDAKLIDEKLASIRVCDTAVGSGAFLVGMMHEIIRARNALTPYIGRNDERTPYNFKREAIQNILYGVDIDPGAVDIAKLRLWLSLIVDEEDRAKIQPLPNLDYKIVQGNSLLSVPRILENWKQFNKMEELKPLYFNETSARKKQEYRNQIDELIRQITKSHNDFDFKVYFSEVFHNKGGFNVVIGNPPYIQLQKDGGNLAQLFEKQNYQTFARTGDIYTLFYEKGLQLLKNNGILTFITSNKWMRAGYGEKTRKFFLKYNPLLLIDLGPGVFENATVDTNILIIQKAPNQNHLKAITYNDKKLSIEEAVNTQSVILEKLSKDAWFIGSRAEQLLKEKIKRIGKPLKYWNVKIYRGVVTGLNEAFIIDSKKREEILNSCQDDAERSRTEAIIKPILRGRDIKRYTYEWAGLWVIFIPWHFPLHKYTIIQGASVKAEIEFKRQYPTVYNHLLQFKELLSKRNKEETGIRYEWYAMQRCAATYYPEFEKEKVVWAETDQSLNTVIVPSGMYLQKTCFMIITNKPFLINSLLNSKVSQWFIRNKSSNLGTKGLSLTKDTVKEIPLPPITASNQGIVSQIESLVDKILSAKKENPAAGTQNWERAIDRLVYKLYDLTDEEINIVEESKQRL